MNAQETDWSGAGRGRNEDKKDWYRRSWHELVPDGGEEIRRVPGSRPAQGILGTSSCFYVIFALVLGVVDGLAGTVHMEHDIGLFGTVRMETDSLFGIIFGVALFLPSLAVSIRRLHDTGRSGWWLLINFIPLIGLIVFLVFAAQDSEPGDNRYGAKPQGVRGGLSRGYKGQVGVMVGSQVWSERHIHGIRCLMQHDTCEGRPHSPSPCHSLRGANLLKSHVCGRDRNLTEGGSVSERAIWLNSSPP